MVAVPNLSSESNPKIAMLFGGAGFIGRHLTEQLLQQGFDEVWIGDLYQPTDKDPAWHNLLELGRVRTFMADVRKAIAPQLQQQQTAESINTATPQLVGI